MMKDERDFINDLVLTFPEIKEEILDEDYAGLVGLQIGCLRRFTQEAIDKGNLNTVAKSFNFFERNVEDVEYKVENALVICYAGKLVIQENTSAERLLPQRLKSFHKQLR